MGGSSWLTAVKRAFRSPTKDSEKKSCRRKVDHQREDEQKKTEKKRWLFKRYSSNTTTTTVIESRVVSTDGHALAVAAATAAAAEAAAATAKAAVEIIRLSQPSNATLLRQHCAAKLIQAAFRGYLARRALIALKGIVKLQALIRGQNVRKQANMTMKCMQALLRVQARVRDQRARLSYDGGRKSVFGIGERSSYCESRYLKDIRDRRSMSRDGSFVSDEWRDCPVSLDAGVKGRNEASSTHENTLAYAFSQQNKIRESDRIRNEDDIIENRASCLEQGWTTASRQWEMKSRVSLDHKRDSIKTVEMDSIKTFRKSYSQSPIHKQASQLSGASPHRRSSSLHSINQPAATPSSVVPKPRTPQIRSASPRCLREEKSYSTANTPSLRSISRLTSTSSNPQSSTSVSEASMPNYMASTVSAKARIRSHSAPRQRSSTPERDRSGPGSAKKRLTYPVPEPYYVSCGFGSNQSLKSPSFKSVQSGYVGMELQSNQSCYTDSIGGEISPCSTTDLRRWLR